VSSWQPCRGGGGQNDSVIERIGPLLLLLCNKYHCVLNTRICAAVSAAAAAGVTCCLSTIVYTFPIYETIIITI